MFRWRVNGGPLCFNSCRLNIYIHVKQNEEKKRQSFGPGSPVTNLSESREHINSCLGRYDIEHVSDLFSMTRAGLIVVLEISKCQE